jgi:hypothetical protein
MRNARSWPQRDPHWKPSLRAVEVASWAPVLVGPIAWFADQQVIYALVPRACATGSHFGIHAANLVALLAVVAGAVLGFRDWRMAGEVSDELDRAAGHDRFLGLLGLMLCAFFVLPIAAQAIAAFIIDPCQR